MKYGFVPPLSVISLVHQHQPTTYTENGCFIRLHTSFPKVRIGNTCQMRHNTCILDIFLS